MSQICAPNSFHSVNGQINAFSTEYPELGDEDDATFNDAITNPFCQDGVFGSYEEENLSSSLGFVEDNFISTEQLESIEEACGLGRAGWWLDVDRCLAEEAANKLELGDPNVSGDHIDPTFYCHQEESELMAWLYAPFYTDKRLNSIRNGLLNCLNRLEKIHNEKSGILTTGHASSLSVRPGVENRLGASYDLDQPRRGPQKASKNAHRLLTLFGPNAKGVNISGQATESTSLNCSLACEDVEQNQLEVGLGYDDPSHQGPKFWPSPGPIRKQDNFILRGSYSLPKPSSKNETNAGNPKNLGKHQLPETFNTPTITLGNSYDLATPSGANVLQSENLVLESLEEEFLSGKASSHGDSVRGRILPFAFSSPKTSRVRNMTNLNAEPILPESLRLRLSKVFNQDAQQADLGRTYSGDELNSIRKFKYGGIKSDAGSLMCTSLLMQGARRPANTRLGESYSIRGSTNTDSIAADEIPCLADGEFGSFSHLDYLSEAPIPPNVCDTSSTRQPGLRQSCVCLPSKNTEHSNTSPDLFASIEPRTNGIAPISNLNHLEGQHPRALVTLESVASGAGGKLSLSLSELTDRFSRSATSTLPLKHAVNPLSSSYTGLPNYVATTINVNGNVVGVTEKKPGDENLTELCLTNSLDGLIPRSGLSGGIMQTSNLFRLAEQQEANLRAHSGSWGRLNESLGSLGRQSTTLTKAEQRRTSAAVVGGGGGGDSSTKHLSTSTSTELRASGSVPVPSLALLVAQLQLDASAGGVPDEEGSGGSSHVRSLSGNCLVTSCANAVGGSWSRPSSRPESPSTIDMVGVGRSGTLPASTKDSSERHADLPETMVTSVLRGSFTLDKPTTLGLPEIGSPPLAYASLQISSQFLS